MPKKTYTALLPKSLVAFAQAYGGKQKRDRNQTLELIQAQTPKTKLNQAVQALGYNKRHANSMMIDIQGKWDAAVEHRQLHIETIQGKIKSAQKQIEKWHRKLEKLIYPCCDIRRNKWKSTQHKLRFKLHHKRRYLIQQQRRQEKLESKPISVNFGTPNNFIFVGSQGESFGNQICQYDGSQLKIRLTPDLEREFGAKYVTADLKFKYGQDAIIAALMRRAVSRSGKVYKPTQGSALTWRIYHKNNRWYISVTVNVTVVPNQSLPVQYGCIGVDLNPGVVGWCYTDSNGNPVEKGQFKVNLHSRTSAQVKAELADVVVKLVELSEKYACAIVIERLDFSGKKKQMREQGRRISRMLNAFAYGTFKHVLQVRCWSRGVQLIKVNPAYSSLIGLTKFMRIYGMSSDTAAGLVLARRAMRLSESVPGQFASLVVRTRKHVWSSWYRLNKKLKGVRRHSFYQPMLTAYLSDSPDGNVAQAQSEEPNHLGAVTLATEESVKELGEIPSGNPDSTVRVRSEVEISSFG